MRYKVPINIFCSCFLLLTAMGCATFVRTDPSWSAPVELNLDNQAMADAVVHMGCGTRAGEGRLNPSRHAFCEAMAVNVEHMGATVLADWREAAKQEERSTAEDVSSGAPNEAGEARPLPVEIENGFLFRVDYVDRLEGTKFCDGWSILFFIMTFSWYPLVCDDPATAELLFYDGDIFALQERVTLRVHARKYMGIGALYFHMANMMKNSAPKYGNLVGTTLQNEVYRFYFKSRRARSAMPPPEVI